MTPSREDYSSLWKETSAPFLSLSPFFPLLATLDLAAVPGGGVGLGDGRRVERNGLAFALSGSIHALPRTRGRQVAQERTRSGRDRTAESRSGKKPPSSATWPISPGRGVQLRFSNNDDDNSNNKLPLTTSHGCLSRCHDPISFPAGKSARLESPSMPLTDEEEAFLAPGMNSVFGDQFWAVLNSDS